MVLTIDGHDYNVKFGIGFLRELDKKYFTETQSGIKFGMGAETKIPMILTNDVITLAEFLYVGTCTEEKRPTQAQIDSFIDETEDIEALFKEVVEELKKQNATKLTIGELEKNLKKQEEALARAAQEDKR